MKVQRPRDFMSPWIGKLVLPHWFEVNSRLPRIFGRLVGRPTFYAWTVFFWTFVDDAEITPQQIVHEHRHVEQFVEWWIVGLVGWVVLSPSWWWLLATPLTFTVAYLLAGVWAIARGDHFYRGNAFEIDARRKAREGRVRLR